MRYLKRIITKYISSLIEPQIKILPEEKGKIGKDVRVGTTSFLNFSKLLIEKNVYIGHYNYIDASQGVTIKEGVQITNYVSILNHSSHDAIRLYGAAYRQTEKPDHYYNGDIYIGEYTFIGPYTTVMPGSSIGKSSIIHGNSFVKGKFPDYSIISGNPATIIGSTQKRDLDLLNGADPYTMYPHYCGNTPPKNTK